MGNKELKEMIVFLAGIANAGDKATKDGLQISDMQYIMGSLLEAPEAFKGMEDIPAEFKDLDAAEMADINVAVAAKLDLEDDKVEAVVEKAFSAVLSLYGVYKEIQILRA